MAAKKDNKLDFFKKIKKNKTYKGSEQNISPGTSAGLERYKSAVSPLNGR